MSNKNLNFQIRTHLYKEDHSFGPGVARIMELVDETGSLSRTYETMGLSSSKGWKMLKRAEKDLGFPLIISTVGGSGGGNSRLSDKGRILLKKYREFNLELDRESRLIFDSIFGDFD